MAFVGRVGVVTITVHRNAVNSEPRPAALGAESASGARGQVDHRIDFVGGVRGASM